MGDKYAGPSSYMATTAENQNNALAGGAENIMDPNGKLLMTPLVEYRPNTKKRNKVANTPMARARYADKAPKINIRKAYQE